MKKTRPEADLAEKKQQRQYACGEKHRPFGRRELDIAAHDNAKRENSRDDKTGSAEIFDRTVFDQQWRKGRPSVNSKMTTQPVAAAKAKLLRPITALFSLAHA
jgi:hypothetical protein